jgi:putative redox protein
MTKFIIAYEGNLTTRLTNESGKEIFTDAPKENKGRGEHLSPTDLVAVSLGSCMLTVMAMFADRHEIKLAGVKVGVVKEMTQKPVHRIGKIAVNFTMPGGIKPDERKMLENAAMACPVHKSLHPDIGIPVVFSYPD